MSGLTARALNHWTRLSQCLLLALPLLVAMPPAQANLSEVAAKSAAKRMGQAVETRALGRAVYRRLPAAVEKTFLERRYAQRVLKEDLIVYRYHSPLNAKAGRYVFATTDKYYSEKALRSRLAIPPTDNIKGRHITEVATYRIPRNTMISEGAVAPAFGFKGGGKQIVLESPPDAWLLGNQGFKTWKTAAGQLH